MRKSYRKARVCDRVYNSDGGGGRATAEIRGDRWGEEGEARKWEWVICPEREVEVLVWCRGTEHSEANTVSIPPCTYLDSAVSARTVQMARGAGRLHPPMLSRGPRDPPQQTHLASNHAENSKRPAYLRNSRTPQFTRLDDGWMLMLAARITLRWVRVQTSPGFGFSSSTYVFWKRCARYVAPNSV